MAAAAPSALASSEEKTNGAKLSRLLIDGGTSVLRNVFDSYHPPANLAADLSACYPILNNLLHRRILNGHQWDKLFPPGGATPDSSTFDITLLFLLLTNICGLSPPLSGWHKKPPPSDTSREGNLARIKFFRNVLYGHVSTTAIDTPTFSALWQEISAVLVALGFDQAEINRLKAEHCGEEDYLDVLRNWADTEEDIKSRLKDIRHTQTTAQQTTEECHQTLQENKTKLDQVHQVVTEIRQSQLNADQEDEILKKLAKVDTQNIVQYYTDRYLEGTRQSIFAKVNNWLSDINSPNRVMVISGNPGMGKSVIAAVMCKRMQEDGRLSGSHFCQHDRARHRNPKVMLQSLAYHLSYCLPGYKKALVEQLSRNLGLEISDMEVGDLFELLFEVPLGSLKDPGSTSLVVIDALDESEYQGRNELLEVIAKYFNKLPVWIRFLVTTRPEINICESLKSLEPLLLEPNDEENLEDICLCFKEQLSYLLQAKNHELILKELVQKSEGSILCAQFLVDFIKKNFSVLTLEQLNSTLLSGISSVYLSYFKRLESGLCKELKVTEDQFFNFLSAITAAREPLPLGFVPKLLFSGTMSSAVQRKVNKAIACISSLLPVQDDRVHFLHKSVKDWLTNESCYEQHIFSVDENQGHRILSLLCIDEFDAVKRKGVDSSQQFSNTAKYALQHGIQHMLESDESTRACSLEEIVNKYVLDLELVYAKLCVNNTAASEDIHCVKKRDGLKALCVERQSTLGALLFLLRKHGRALKELPHTIFQTLLNEGGPELSSEASNLLGTKYSDISHMEYLNKSDLQGAVETLFYCSSEVACFDVSPQSDYMVCECRDGTIQLWSLHTGKLMWKRPVMKIKLYANNCGAYRVHEPSPFRHHPLLSCFSSAVFHPTKEVVLPGVLSHAYTFQGDQIRLFSESNCSFSVCSISGNTIITDSPDDAKCLIMWSLKDGTEITRVTRDEDVLSFARSRDGKLLVISHFTGSICLVDVMNGFRTLAELATFNGYGRVEFSPDHQFIYCWCFHQFGFIHLHLCLTIHMEASENFTLSIASPSVGIKRLPFLLGDQLFCVAKRYRYRLSMFERSFVFVFNKQSVLKSSPCSDVIEILPLDYLSNDVDVKNTFVRNFVFSLNGETVYTVTHEKEGARLTAWDVSSGELKAEKSNVSEIRGPDDCHLVAVRDGVLFTTSSGTIELWNPELSECIRCWTYTGVIRGMISISAERVVLTGRTPRAKVFILDTTRGGEVLTIKLFDRQFIACNSKCQLVTTADSLPESIQLWYGTTLLWKKTWPPLGDEYYLSLGVMFSPGGHFFVIWGVTPLHKKGVYVLDAISGNTLHILLRGEDGFHRCKFVSDEECVILTSHKRCSYLRLFDVRSGHLLSVIDIIKEFSTYLLASCPGKGLIAIADRHHTNFKVIQMKIPKLKNKDNFLI